MPQAFNGTLGTNLIMGSLYNMVIRQSVFADNIKGTSGELADRFRIDGTLFGDRALFYATDVLESAPWLNDAEAANLLELHRPADPECQEIIVDNFRQIRLTVDEYLSKQAWMAEGSFQKFLSVMKGWIQDTKRIYDSTIVNTFVGTTETNEGKQQRTITYGDNDNFGLVVAKDLANLLTELKDISDDYNDYGYLRSYAEEDLLVIFNSDVYNEITNVNLPVVFHNQGLLDKFDRYVLPAKYFGEVVGESGTSTTNPTNITVRSLIETKYEVASKEADKRAKLAKDGKYYVHVFPGQLLPGGVEFNQNEAYNEATNIAYKVVHKKSIPWMSAFEVGTSFFNPRSLTTNHYLTFGHSTLDYLADKPFITAKYEKQ